jgi:hypothetical protein
LIVRHFGIPVILGGSLTLLTRRPTAALLLAGFLTRRLILLAGLVLVRHVVSFHGNVSTTARPWPRSDKTNRQLALPPRSGEHPRLKFRNHHTNTQATPNDQAGTAVLAQPMVRRAIGSLSRKQRDIKNVEFKPQ